MNPSAARRQHRTRRAVWTGSSALVLLLIAAGLGLAMRAGWPLAFAPEPASRAPGQAAATVEPGPEPTQASLAEAPTPPPAPTADVAAPPAPTSDAGPSPDLAGSPELKSLPSRSPATGPAVALTFDAGDDRGYAEDILDTLRASSVPASFGVTGQWAEKNPDLVRRMAADGHQVINHTLDHRSFTGLSDELGGLSSARRRQELEDADAILAPLIGHSTRPWYRLPYGDDAAGISADVAAIGFTRKAGWTVDSLGWRGLAAGDIVARCLKLAEPDAVYVFHVGHTSQDGLALARIIAGVRERGLGFATLEALE